MSDAATYQRVVAWIEDDAARRYGVPVKVARPIVAREIGVAPGTLENVRKGRTKGLKGWIERKIDDALIRVIDRQKAGLDHELALANARRSGGHGRVVAQAAAARDALAGLIDEAEKSSAAKADGA